MVELQMLGRVQNTTETNFGNNVTKIWTFFDSLPLCHALMPLCHTLPYPLPPCVTSLMNGPYTNPDFTYHLPFLYLSIQIDSCADNPQIGLSMSSVFASLDMKLASTWKQQGVRAEGILNPVLNMNCIVSCTNKDLYIQLLIFIEKFSPLPGFEPTTYQVIVYEADDIPMCHRAYVTNQVCLY